MRMRHASGSLVLIVAPTHTIDDVVPMLPKALNFRELHSVRCKKVMSMYLKNVQPVTLERAE
jgi:hypothetical protein